MWWPSTRLRARAGIKGSFVGARWLARCHAACLPHVVNVQRANARRISERYIYTLILHSIQAFRALIIVKGRAAGCECNVIRRGRGSLIHGRPLFSVRAVTHAIIIRRAGRAMRTRGYNAAWKSMRHVASSLAIALIYCGLRPIDETRMLYRQAHANIKCILLFPFFLRVVSFPVFSRVRRRRRRRDRQR